MRLYLFRDQDDYVKKISSEDIINIIGLKGSGKTSSTSSYLVDDGYIVVNCDRLLELPSLEKEDKELSTIRYLLLEKHHDISSEFSECYKDIVEYILNKKKKGMIEGNVLQDLDISLLRGSIIVKRTGVLKSFIRAVKRDYHNMYFMNLEKEKHKYLYRITRFFKIFKRRMRIFRQGKDIEVILNKLEKIDK